MLSATRSALPSAARLSPWINRSYPERCYNAARASSTAARPVRRQPSAAPKRSCSGAPRHAAPHPATPYHVTMLSRHATPRHATPRHATIHHATPRHAMPCTNTSMHARNYQARVRFTRQRRVQGSLQGSEVRLFKKRAAKLPFEVVTNITFRHTIQPETLRILSGIP